MPRPREILTSFSNPIIKHLKTLDKKKARQDAGVFLAEGSRLVEQGLDNDWAIDTLVVAAPVADRAKVQSLIERSESSGGRVVVVSDALMSKVTHKDNAQSVIATFQMKGRALQDLPVLPTGLVIGLYEVRDPGNLGTILRTADCAAVSAVVLIGTCCDPYSFEAVRASMGSVFETPFAHADMVMFDQWRRGLSLSMVAASVNGTKRHDAANMQAGTVILMGNEQSGLPEDVEKRCDTLALIPMRGGADSLNLAQATAIMTYEAWRQRDYR